jgi:hypothetical protein
MRNRRTAREWIKILGLRPHPEGGYYREIYRAAERIPAAVLPARYRGPRAFATSIYFLLAGAQFSALHRMASDEQWHFYDGNALCLTTIASDGAVTRMRLGRDSARGEQFQAVIPAGNWMGARLAAPGRSGFALIGCTVAPGFDFRDFQMGKRSDLLARYSQHRRLIISLTRPR